MSAFHTFSENELYSMLRAWRESGVNSLNITCGPLIVFASYDFGEEIWRVHGIRRGRIIPGSFRFYSSRYSLFRCLYGIIRTQGLESDEWEESDPHSFRYHTEYLNLISHYIPYMRVKMQSGSDEGIFIQNLLSHSYMKIKPVRWTHGRLSGMPLIQQTESNDIHESHATLPLPAATTLEHLGFVNEEGHNPN